MKKSQKKEVNPVLSIVISTLNEERFVGSLLEDILNNTYKDYEVIVSDSGSTDKTGDVVEWYTADYLNMNCIHASEKGVAVARNNGAAHAKGKYILFLDADVRLTDTFLENSVNEMEHRNIDIAGYYIKPSGNRIFDKCLWFVYNNILFRPLQYIYPMATGGGGIIVKKNLHDKIGGFDKRIIIGEDHDYVQRGSRLGKFRMLKHEKSEFNMRRFNEKGRLTVVGQWTIAALYYMVKQRKMPFEYRMGGTTH